MLSAEPNTRLDPTTLASQPEPKSRVVCSMNWATQAFQESINFKFRWKCLLSTLQSQTASYYLYCSCTSVRRHHLFLEILPPYWSSCFYLSTPFRIFSTFKLKWSFEMHAIPEGSSGSSIWVKSTNDVWSAPTFLCLAHSTSAMPAALLSLSTLGLLCPRVCHFPFLLPGKFFH